MKQQGIRKTTRRGNLSVLARLRRLPAYLRDGRVPLFRKGVLVLAVLYVVLPFDFDWVPVLGWLDDLGVIGTAAVWLINDLQRYAAAGSDPGDDVPEPDSGTVDR